MYNAKNSNRSETIKLELDWLSKYVRETWNCSFYVTVQTNHHNDKKAQKKSFKRGRKNGILTRFPSFLKLMLSICSRAEERIKRVTDHKLDCIQSIAHIPPRLGLLKILPLTKYPHTDASTSIICLPQCE